MKCKFWATATQNISVCNRSPGPSPLMLVHLKVFQSNFLHYYEQYFTETLIFLPLHFGDFKMQFADGATTSGET